MPKTNWEEKLKKDFPVLYDLMEQQEVFGVKIIIRFRDWQECLIRTTIQQAREEAIREERERIIKKLPNKFSNLPDLYTNGYNNCLKEVKDILNLI